MFCEEFPPTERLKKRRDYLAVQKRGRVVHLEHVLVAFLPNKDKRRIGITVSSKIGNAVTRNRLKRLFREVWRRKKETLPDGNDYVFIARKSATQLTFQGVSELFDVLAKKLNRNLDRNLERK